jgi:hypothetical protein
MVVVQQIQITQLGLALALLWSEFVMAFHRGNKNTKKKNEIINNETNAEGKVVVCGRRRQMKAFDRVN